MQPASLVLRRVSRLLFAALLCALSLSNGPAPAGGPPSDNSHSVKLEQLARTYGINFDPFEVRGHPDALSSADLLFEVNVDFAGGWFPLVASNPSTCSGPCNRVAASAASGRASLDEGVNHNLLNCTVSSSNSDHGKRTAVCNVKVVRFAQFGRVEGSLPFDWQVEMEQNASLLSGTLRAGFSEGGNLIYPGAVRLGGKMILTIRPEGEQPLRLRSRKEPVFEGTTSGWPPYGLEMRLVNAPIPYYLESEIADPAAKPIASVAYNKVTIGRGPSPFFAAKPQIVSAQIVDPAGTPWRQGEIGGVSLRWTPTAGTLDGLKINRYHIYRNRTPYQLRNWKQIASIPARRPAYVDTGYRGEPEVAYLVTHSTLFPLGYEYEGLPGTPVVVKAPSQGQGPASSREKR